MAFDKKTPDFIQVFRMSAKEILDDNQKGSEQLRQNHSNKTEEFNGARIGDAA